MLSCSEFKHRGKSLNKAAMGCCFRCFLLASYLRITFVQYLRCREASASTRPKLPPILGTAIVRRLCSEQHRNYDFPFTRFDATGSGP